MGWDLFPAHFHWGFATANRKWVRTLSYSRHSLDSNSRTCRDDWSFRRSAPDPYRWLLFALYSYRPPNIVRQSNDWFPDSSHAMDSVNGHAAIVSVSEENVSHIRSTMVTISNTGNSPAAQCKLRAISHESFLQFPQFHRPLLRPYSVRCWCQRATRLSAIGRLEKWWIGGQSEESDWTYFWFDVVEDTVLDAPQSVLCFVDVNAKIERMQRCKVLVPRLGMLQRFQHTIANEYHVWILFPAFGQKSFMLKDDRQHSWWRPPMRQSFHARSTYNANPSIIGRIDWHRYNTWIHGSTLLTN